MNKKDTAKALDIIVDKKESMKIWSDVHGNVIDLNTIEHTLTDLGIAEEDVRTVITQVICYRNYYAALDIVLTMRDFT